MGQHGVIFPGSRVGIGTVQVAPASLHNLNEQAIEVCIDGTSLIFHTSFHSLFPLPLSQYFHRSGLVMPLNAPDIQAHILLNPRELHSLYMSEAYMKYVLKYTSCQRSPEVPQGVWLTKRT
jgi:hypothetical protein